MARIKENATLPTVRLRDGSKFFQYQFRIEGERFTGSTKCKEEMEALAFAQAEQRRILSEREGTISPHNASAIVVIDHYIETKRRIGVKASTLKRYGHFRTRFEEFFGSRVYLTQLNTERFIDWREWLLKQQSRSWNMEYKLKTGASYDTSNWGKQTKERKYFEKNRLKSKPIPTLTIKGVREHLSFISSVYKYFDQPSPIRKVGLPKKSQADEDEDLRFYHEFEVGKIMDQLNVVVPNQETALKNGKHHLWMFKNWFIVLLYSGIRSGEAQGIRNKDVTVPEMAFSVLSEKTNRRRRIDIGDIHRDGWEALCHLMTIAESHYWPEGLPDDVDFSDKPIYFKGIDWLRKTMESVCKSAGVEYRGIHAIRHTTARFAIQDGWNVAVLSKFLGHLSFDFTVRVYYTWIPQDVKRIQRRW